MNVVVHLVSAPWSKPDSTSMQLGALHAYVDRAFAGAVDVHSYSAFVAIPHRAAGGDLFAYADRMATAGEHAYMAVFLERYWDELHARGETGDPQLDLDRLLRTLRASGSRARPAKLTRSLLQQLRRATEEYLDEELGPRLVAGAINVIGFSLNYDQIYASAYMARYLAERYADFAPTFLFGGYSTSVPHVVDLLHRLRVPGCLVVGEGETKLEMILRALRDLGGASGREVPPDALARDAHVAAAAPGVYEVRANTQVFEARPADYATQLPGLTELPTPDYREYFQTLEAMTEDAETFKLMVGECHIMVEGSRGCFAKCDFCGLNSTWKGFRKSTPEAILGQVVELAARHEATRFDFVDNVCDTWAEKFADLVSASGMRYRTLHELRAHHDEAFWTKLAMAGSVEIQIGIEALSQPLLSRIGKGTRVVQNVAVQKFLTELKVWSYGNLITDHPRSTAADVVETQRVLEQCPHLGEFGLARYGIAPGSPLYNGLTAEERRSLRPAVSTRLPAQTVPFALENFCAVPPSLACDPKTARAWTQFRSWFASTRTALAGRRASLDVSRLGPHRLLVVDTRRDRAEHHVLEGDECAVYDACHAGLKLHHLPERVGLDRDRTMAVVELLIRREILLHIEDSVLSIALRPRDELIQNLHRGARPAVSRLASVPAVPCAATVPLLQVGRARAAS